MSDVHHFFNCQCCLLLKNKYLQFQLATFLQKAFTVCNTRLRMICSEDEDLDWRLEEYGRHLTISGWKYKTAKERLVEGVKKDREKLLNQPRRRKEMKIMWVSTYNPKPQSAFQNSYNQEKSPSSSCQCS